MTPYLICLPQHVARQQNPRPRVQRDFYPDEEITPCFLRFRDILKVAARNEMKKELMAALKRVIHYVEAMATDDDLRELQKDGFLLAKPRSRKKRSKADHAQVELAPAGA